MAQGFSPMLAFGSGLAEGAEAVESKKIALDDEYRKLAMQTSFEEERDAAKKKQADQQAQQADDKDRAWAMQNANNSGGKLLQQSHVSTLNSPENNQTPNFPGATQAAPPTNTPNPSPAPQQTSVSMGEAQGQSAPPGIGINANPQGAWTQGATSPEVASASAGLNAQNPINSMVPPAANATAAPTNDSGPIFPSDEGKIPDPDGVMRTQAEIDDILARGAKADPKAHGPDRWNLGKDSLEKDQLEAIDKKPAAIYQNDNLLKFVANKAGLPYNKDPELAGMTNKDFLENRKTDQGRIQKEADGAISDASDTITRLNNIVGLGKFVQTGGASGIPGVAQLQSSFSAEAAEMQKDISYLTLRNRPNTGYSRVTNADLNMFSKASPSFANPTAANYVIAAGLMADKIDAASYWNFRQSWINKYGGDDPATINRLWDIYKDKNPIFDPRSTPEHPVMNQNRQTYMTFFKGKSVDDLLAQESQTTAIPSNMKIGNNQTTPNTIPLRKDGTPDFSGF